METNGSSKARNSNHTGPFGNEFAPQGAGSSDVRNNVGVERDVYEVGSAVGAAGTNGTDFPNVENDKTLTQQNENGTT